MSMASFRPKTGPPASRALVNPRMSLSVAALPAAMRSNPTSAVSAATLGMVEDARWV